MTSPAEVQAYLKRAGECVEALRGIENPKAFMEAVSELAPAFINLCECLEAAGDNCGHCRKVRDILAKLEAARTEGKREL